MDDGIGRTGIAVEISTYPLILNQFVYFYGQWHGGNGIGHNPEPESGGEKALAKDQKVNVRARVRTFFRAQRGLQAILDKKN